MTKYNLGKIELECKDKEKNYDNNFVWQFFSYISSMLLHLKKEQRFSLPYQILGNSTDSNLYSKFHQE